MHGLCRVEEIGKDAVMECEELNTMPTDYDNGLWHGADQTNCCSKQA